MTQLIVDRRDVDFVLHEKMVDLIVTEART